MTSCENIIEATGKLCGADIDGSFDMRFCSEKCSEQKSRAELAELGITPEMMKEALDGYYECNAMLDATDATTDEGTESPLPDSSSPPQQALP